MKSGNAVEYKTPIKHASKISEHDDESDEEVEYEMGQKPKVVDYEDDGASASLSEEDLEIDQLTLKQMEDRAAVRILRC